MSALLEKSSKNASLKRIEASWDGCGLPSKIFSIAEEASEKMRIFLMSGDERTSLLIHEAA
jgi:hypothetical protein